MKQFFCDYRQWEDYINGMYCGSVDNDDGLIEKAKSLLCNAKLFNEIIRDVIKNWPISTRVNLSNLGMNRRAWLGQAACNYLYNVPEILTRVAWGEMNDIQRFEANTIAERYITKYDEGDESDPSQTELF